MVVVSIIFCTFEKAYPRVETTYPIIFKEESGNLVVLVGTQQLNGLKTLNELMTLLNE